MIAQQSEAERGGGERRTTGSAGCLGCGRAGGLSRVREYRTNTSYGQAVFGRAAICVCDACGLAQVQPPPDAATLAHYYEEDYRKVGLYGGDVSDPARFPRDNLFYYNRGQSIAELVSRHVRDEPREILDVGTGFGHVLHALGERYPEARRLAIEFSEVCVRHLETIGVEAVAEPMEEVLPRLERRFDVIVLSHVLEHLLRPAEAVALLRTRMAPGGLLYIEVPHIPAASLDEYLDNVWAPRYDEPHISFFSPESLRGVLSRAGLEVVFCETAGPEYRRVSALRFRMPPLRHTIHRLLPRRLFHFLRGLELTKPVRVRDREEVFYAYGGERIWIRALARLTGG